MESQHPSPDYIVTSTGSSLRYEEIDLTKAQYDPYYWLGEMQPKVQPDVHALDEQQIRREFHTIIDNMRPDDTEIVERVIHSDLLDETHVKWNLELANAIYEQEFVTPSDETVEVVNKETAQQWVFDAAMNLAINRLHKSDLKEFGFTKQELKGTKTIQKTSLPDVLLMANAWDNTDRDPALLFMLRKMIGKLEVEEERARNTLFLETALSTGKRFIQEDHNQFDTSYLDTAYGVQNDKVSMLADDRAA